MFEEHHLACVYLLRVMSRLGSFHSTCSGIFHQQRGVLPCFDFHWHHHCNRCLLLAGYLAVLIFHSWSEIIHKDLRDLSAKTVCNTTKNRVQRRKNKECCLEIRDGKRIRYLEYSSFDFTNCFMPSFLEEQGRAEGCFFFRRNYT